MALLFRRQASFKLNESARERKMRARADLSSLEVTDGPLFFQRPVRARPWLGVRCKAPWLADLKIGHYKGLARLVTLGYFAEERAWPGIAGWITLILIRS